MLKATLGMVAFLLGAAPAMAQPAPASEGTARLAASAPGRSGPLTPREMAMAKAAWQYFIGATRETGLSDSVANYPSTTLWDVASYVAALVAARELGIIDKREFDLRTLNVLKGINGLDLFRGELPNKVYETTTGAKVDYSNKPGEIGFSAIDIGRMLTWLAILKERYPYLANSIDQSVLRWNFCRVVDEKGSMFGAGVDGAGKTQYYQEGRLGYEEYAAKGFGLWGFNTQAASRAAPFATTDIYGIKIPFDGRDPRVFKSDNYVLTESYLLDGLELNWDLADDNYSGPDLFTDGWRAEFSYRVYMAQRRRFEETGILTARTEHQVEGDPFFVYDTVYSSGYPWNTIDPTGKFQPERAALATKGAISMWVLFDEPYTEKLFEAVADLYTPTGGFYEGIYENGKGVIPLHTANTNGIILTALLYKVQGPMLKRGNADRQVWFTQGVDSDARKEKCLPDRPRTEAVHCPSETLCNKPVSRPALRLEEFEYCEPVAAKDWFPGCAFGHPEPAARSCKTTATKVSVAPAPPVPGAFCALFQPPPPSRHGAARK